MADDISAYVNSLYQLELGRAAEAEGLKAWSDAIASGAMSREEVANAINKSAEGTRYDIGTTYQQQLGREGTVDQIAAKDPGLQYWTDAVSSGRMTLAEAQNAIARSQEGTAYDVQRIYNSDLQRKGDFNTIASTDPGAKYWQDALMSGRITEQQFIDSVRASDEYKKLNGLVDNKTTTVDPALKALQDKLDAQDAAFKKQQAEWDAQRKQMLASPLQALQGKQVAYANQGSFPATQPVTASAGTASSPYAGIPAAQPVAATPAIAPAPQQYVPQTYLAPAPPQYRNVNPFGMPFNNPFMSYSSIASRFQPSALPSPAQAVAASAEAPAAVPSPYAMVNPFMGYPFYTGTYGAPAPATTPTT